MYNENETVRVTEIYVPMDDGVKLYTRVMVPSGVEKCPVVFIRTPYEKAHDGMPHSIQACAKNEYIQNGYAVVLQHCRGTGDSEGICIPYHHEREDGLRTLEYIRRLPFYDRAIYLYGRSYLTTVHLSYLNTEPEDIKGALFEIQTDRMYFRNYRNGCCARFCNIDWWLSMMKRQYPEPKIEGSEIRPYKDIMKRLVGEDVPEFTDCLLHDEYDDFWISDPRTDVIDHLKFPVLFTEGWYDCYTDGMFSMWERLPEETKKTSAFVVGPWSHGTKVSERAEYPLPKGNIPDDYVVQWFNHIRDDKPYPYAECGKVNYYSVGGERWYRDLYPCEESAQYRLYFNGDHSLSVQPLIKGELSYRYDPEERLDYFKYYKVFGDIFKANKAEDCESVVSFVSPPFEEEQCIYGRIRWHMKVKSDCEDTAFYIRIYFMEDGEAYNLTDTITSLSHIDKNYRAGEEMLIDLELPPMGFTVKKGNRIRVDIASDGNIYVPHSNTKDHWAEVTETKVATNTLICDGEAYTELPLKPASEEE